MLKFPFQTKFNTKLTTKTKVWFQIKLELSSPVSNQTIVMCLDRQLSLNIYNFGLKPNHFILHLGQMHIWWRTFTFTILLP